MKITRYGSDKERKITTLLDEESKPDLEGSRLKFRFLRVPDPNPNRHVNHNYTVELSKKELRRMLRALLDAATDR